LQIVYIYFQIGYANVPLATTTIMASASSPNKCTNLEGCPIYSSRFLLLRQI
jgi:hypothetical protein